MNNKYFGHTGGLIGPVIMTEPLRNDYENADDYHYATVVYERHLSSLTPIPCEGWVPEVGKEYDEKDFRFSYMFKAWPDSNWEVCTKEQYDWYSKKLIKDAVKIIALPAQPENKTPTASQVVRKFERMSGIYNSGQENEYHLPLPAAQHEGAQEPVSDISHLLGLLAQYGGEIVSTASLDVQNINQARASDRMHVDANGLGFVWMPPGLFPETGEELERFEKWFPLEVEIPESLKTLNWMKEKINPTASLPAANDSIGFMPFLKELKNYFGEHDKTPFEHKAFAMVEKMIQSIKASEIVPVANDGGDGLLPKCTLPNDELISKVQDWVKKLCETGGRAWTLRVPVDVNRDPDCLITELCRRLQKQSAPSNNVGDGKRLLFPEFNASVRVADDCSDDVIQALRKMCEIAYNTPVEKEQSPVPLNLHITHLLSALKACEPYISDLQASNISKPEAGLPYDEVLGKAYELMQAAITSSGLLTELSPKADDAQP